MSWYPNNPLTIGQATFSPYVQQPVLNSFAATVQPVAPPVNQGPHMEIPVVNGRESAMAFPMGPNSSAILSDATNPRIWVVTTDSSGYKAVKRFRVIPEDEEEEKKPEDRLAQMDERLSKLEERMNGYGKSDNKPSWKGQSGNGNVPANDRNGQIGKGSDGSGSADGGK